MSKPGIDQLLIASAIDPDLRRRLVESAEDVFAGFDLTEEQKDILRRPDHRMLALLGAALVRQTEAVSPDPQTTVGGPSDDAQKTRTLPDIRLALTLVPCAQYENGQLTGFRYAVWVNALPAGADPASLPPPPGATFPGQALAPLHAVIHVSAVQFQDAAGNPHVGMWASMRQSSNISAPPPAEAAGRPEAPPFGSDLRAEEVRAAVAAVRGATSGARYDKLVDLMHVLRSGDVR